MSPARWWQVHQAVAGLVPCLLLAAALAGAGLDPRRSRAAAVRRLRVHRGGHREFAALLAGAGVALAIASAIIEPATTRAAFGPEPK